VLQVAGDGPAADLLASSGNEVRERRAGAAKTLLDLVLIAL
jgi:hypothetical protein